MATEGEQKTHMERTIKAIKRHDKKGCKIVFLDMTGLVDSPVSRRGICHRSRRDTASINYISHNQ